MGSWGAGKTYMYRAAKLGTERLSQNGGTTHIPPVQHDSPGAEERTLV